MCEQVSIDYFSDTLCVWAYISEIRLEELTQNFGSHVKISRHFMPTFGCTEKRIGQGWANKGGYAGFSDHIYSVSKAYTHINVRPDLWTKTRPTTSTTSHLFLKAVQLLQNKGIIAHQASTSTDVRSPFESISWQIRRAFFERALDISNLKVLRQLGIEADLPISEIDKLMETGEAHAALAADTELRDQYHLQGSPSYILNEGRQILFGNVGYKIIEVNVQEILKQPENQLSWC